MSWMDWGIVAGIITLVAVLLFSILTLYARPKGSTPPTGKRLVPVKPEPVVQRRAA
jgi:hypothetical protein